MKYVARALLAGAIVVSCGLPATDVNSSEIDPTTSLERNDPLSADATTDDSSPSSGLTQDFLALVFPIEYSDIVSAAETFEWPLSSDRAIVRCLEDSGFGSLAAAFEAHTPSFVDDIWLFPNLERLQTVAEAAAAGHLPDTPPPAWVLLNWISGPQSDQGVEGVRLDLEANQQWGTDPAHAEALYEALGACQLAAAEQDPESLEQARLVRTEWIIYLHGLESTDLQSPMAQVMECLRNVDPLLEEVNTPDEWWALAGGHLDSLFGGETARTTEAYQALATINSGYVACMEPMLKARQPIWADLRSTRAEEDLVQLLKLQSALDGLLDE